MHAKGNTRQRRLLCMIIGRFERMADGLMTMIERMADVLRAGGFGANRATHRTARTSRSVVWPAGGWHWWAWWLFLCDSGARGWPRPHGMAELSSM